MACDAFWHIHDLIADDDSFISTSNCPQRPVRYQLAAFLIRVGTESLVKMATVMAVAEGSVYNYMHRVMGAVQCLSDYLAWPGETRQDYISEKFAEKGFPGCLGDCRWPLINPYGYWCRKKFYAATMVDHRRVFTSHELGWPGSVNNSRVFQNSHLWLYRDRYFQAHEFILVDKGALSYFLLCTIADIL
ncbi:hypothetical protein BT96DRAFT_957913 [Gymnopus androsaceus JB14]|uniref:DDE Tnp4 domain-containing protein n=1 Tax=Gymnopus androsaceus JB14 TaxID=1447944 RepID=A0A6A4HFX7_9AGAR|nr:hypothetical protein BT96DRAFT_957913 [Gymnopus androsaceus JB14]